MSQFNTSKDFLHNVFDQEMLKDTFRKNGLVYRLLDRTSTVAFFELRLPNGEVVGYEVCKIHKRRACLLNGIEYPEAEVTPSNEEFGNDGSKCFFPHDLDRAKKFFLEFHSLLQESNIKVISKSG